jgi:hypothetical protein
MENAVPILVTAFLNTKEWLVELLYQFSTSRDLYANQLRPRLKVPCHEIFDLWFFSSNNSIWAPDTRVKAFLHMASYLQRYSTMKSTFLLVSGVNDTADHKSDP